MSFIINAAAYTKQTCFLQKESAPQQLVRVEESEKLGEQLDVTVAAQDLNPGVHHGVLIQLDCFAYASLHGPSMISHTMNVPSFCSTPELSFRASCRLCNRERCLLKISQPMKLSSISSKAFDFGRRCGASHSGETGNNIRQGVPR